MPREYNCNSSDSYPKKCLILGEPASGKSTLMRQFKRYDDDEGTRRRCASTICQQTVADAGHLIEECLLSQHENKYSPDIECHVQHIRDTAKQAKSLSEISRETADAIESVWNDESIRAVWEDRSLFHKPISEQSPYFFGRVQAMTSSDYLPTEEDCLRVRDGSGGITETTLQFCFGRCTMIDVGVQKSKRKQWLRCFEGVEFCLYVIDPTLYDLPCIDDPSRNQLTAALKDFESMISSLTLQSAEVILFMNKIDILERKVVKSSLQDHFPDFTGSQTVNDVAEFISEQFQKCTTKPTFVERLCAIECTGDLPENPVVKAFLNVTERILQTHRT